ncbi:MAG TPA: 2-isopropylmalate synthase [Acidobacteria bacterium]|nr:2-isopropylmalate synthase [Acidobacteriota bacterium]
MSLWYQERDVKPPGDAPPHLTIFDTTLRDGEQSPGCSMHRQEKVALARQLERLGVDVIEAGFPIASPGEAEAVAAVAAEVRYAAVAGLCRTREDDVECAARALAGAVRPRLHVFLATSDLHLEHKLKITRAEALRQVAAAVGHARSLCADVEFSAEDASRSDVAFLTEVLQAAFEAGAGVLNVPDTVGYALPTEYGALFARLVAAIPGAVFSAHCHNDLGLAVANSLAAVAAGARQVEVTINGIGERAGNTALEELAMALYVRREAMPFVTGIRSEQIAPTSRALSAITGVWPQPNKAIVGRNAFAHEAGIHQHGVLAHPLTYEIMTPASVGVPESLLVLGKHCGRHAVAVRLRGLGIVLSPAELEAVTARVKELADRQKFVYDEDLLNLVASPAPVARLLRYHVVSGNHVLPTATVELDVLGERRSASALGKGPLDAVLKAADTALGRPGRELVELHTRSIGHGTEALAEVLLRVRDGDNESTGQAASTDTIEAALRAYLAAGAAAHAIPAATGPSVACVQEVLS